MNQTLGGKKREEKAEFYFFEGCIRTKITGVFNHLIQMRKSSSEPAFIGLSNEPDFGG